MVNKNIGGFILLVEIFFLIFLTGFFPETTHRFLFPLLYFTLYVTTVISLEKNKKTMLWVACLLLVAQGVFKFFNLEIIEAVSKVLNFLFFSFIVISLIQQIASAQQVIIGLMIQVDPLSYNFSQQGDTGLHNSMYYGFVTFATLGYGDLVPLKPYAKSLSILIAVSGQLYVAVIIALLVGKFSTQSQSENRKI